MAGGHQEIFGRCSVSGNTISLCGMVIDMREKSENVDYLMIFILGVNTTVLVSIEE